MRIITTIAVPKEVHEKKQETGKTWNEIIKKGLEIISTEPHEPEEKITKQQ